MPRPLSKASCNTCRRRKLKCDQKKPVCGQCTKANRYCDRTEKPLQIRPSSLQPPTANTSQPPREALQDAKIARLFHHYITELSQWYDLSDSTSSFAVTVPRVAVDECPLLFSAVVALSAMHMCKTTAAMGHRTTAEKYHSRCVELLIALDGGDEVLTNGVALAATCLLRSFEILDSDVDPNMHLRGAYSMVSVQDLLSENLHRGLLAAGFWNYLREDITFSLFEKCPLKIDLDAVSLVTKHESDQDYLNSVTLVLAKTINLVVGRSVTDEVWEKVFQMASAWSSAYRTRLHPFSSQAGGPGEESLLPQIWFLQPCHASTRHYHLVLLIILATHAPENRWQDLRSLCVLGHDSDNMDDLLEALALDICGIAFTTKTPSVIVNAFGPISYCAQFIRSEAAREELARHLLGCKSTIGWPVQRLVNDLKSH